VFTRLFASARDMYEGYIKLRCKMSELAELVPRELARIDAQLLRDSAKIDVRLSALEATLGGLSTKSWIIIGGAAAGTIITWLIVKPAFCDGGAQTRGIC